MKQIKHHFRKQEIKLKKNLIGLDIQDAACKLGHWYVLSEQNMKNICV